MLGNGNSKAGEQSSSHKLHGGNGQIVGATRISLVRSGDAPSGLAAIRK